RYDSIAASAVDENDGGVALAGALAHLTQHDSAGALRTLRTFRDAVWPHSSLLASVGPAVFQGLLWPRTFLLLGDLAAAAGQREEAVRAYRMFVGMWQGGGEEVQPMVRRAREALGRLGG